MTDPQALPASADLSAFTDAWSRSEELLTVLEKLPAKLVLKTGQSARLQSIIGRWQNLEAPGLDGLVDRKSVEDVKVWNRDAEAIISLIIDLYRSPNLKFARFQAINTIEEASFISDRWCWPWENRPSSRVDVKWDKERIIKFGAAASLGLIALVTYLDEE